MIAPLTIACSAYDRTRAIIDGSIRIEGCDAKVLCLPAEEMFVRALTTAEFDVTELSFSRFVADVARGASPYVGIPVFLSRLFRHSAVYVRTDRGIRGPADLKGRVMGVRNYANTASLVARGMLEDEHGVRASDMRWLMGDVDHVERVRIEPPQLPPGFDVRAVPQGRLLSDMLAAGEIDGLVDYQPPRCFVDGVQGVGRLFADHAAAERDYFTRTRIFPIMHLLVVRRAIAERDPMIAARIYDAFTAAKQAAIAALWSPGALNISLPWISEEYSRTVALMGADFWPYGIAANRAAIESIARYVHAQGLAPRRVSIEALFAPGVLSS